MPMRESQHSWRRGLRVGKIDKSIKELRTQGKRRFFMSIIPVKTQDSCVIPQLITAQTRAHTGRHSHWMRVSKAKGDPTLRCGEQCR
mmetsp:Transcript_3047/g.4411  ORF Transcript_3047/g.4411 Transcript_3047/m.4411 type:complete len:87 (-) Transcript_3047:71-331(-)